MTSPPKQLPRRLFELLEEQQEPFLLDNGCSKSKSRRSFKSKAAFKCWRLNIHGFRRRKARASILRCLVAKLVYLKSIKKALNRERSKLFKGETNAAGFLRLSSCRATGKGESIGSEFRWKEVEHSPVSVLELHSDESSSDHNHSMEEENSSTSRLSSPKKPVQIQPRHLLLDLLKEMEDKSWDPCEIFPWEKQRGDMAMLTHLIELDLSETRREWTQFNAVKREIGIEIGGIIFEEMREEFVLDMLGFPCTLES